MERDCSDLERSVALAIGRVIWGGEVVPRGQWLRAARAALKAVEAYYRANQGPPFEQSGWNDLL